MKARKNLFALFVVALCVCLVSAGSVSAETHWDLQAVGPDGKATHLKALAYPDPPAHTNHVVLEGIVLNNPEDMLDSTYDTPASPFMGGQWQIFVQGEGTDYAGTACWMGQNYGKMMGQAHPDDSYTEGLWNLEMARLNHDGMHQIRMGDRVRVTGYVSGYNGKTNVNERHNIASQMDFTVEWLGSTPGLPTPELITLADVKDAVDNDIFDETRMTGGEYYQSQLVRINNVSFTNPSLWGSGVEMEITDGTRTLLCKLGMSGDFDLPSNLAGTFDVVGIFNQEGGYTDGYQIWVMGYDGGTDTLGIVPEPASLMVLALGGLAVLRRRRS